MLSLSHTLAKTVVSTQPDAQVTTHSPAIVKVCRMVGLPVQWVPFNIIPSVHEKIMIISGIFYYPMYSYYRGYRGIIGPV